MSKFLHQDDDADDARAMTIPRSFSSGVVCVVVVVQKLGHFVISLSVLTSTHNLCFEQKSEKYQNFYLKFFVFLVVKFPVYLNRLVLVMHSLSLTI